MKIKYYIVLYWFELKAKVRGTCALIIMLVPYSWDKSLLSVQLVQMLHGTCPKGLSQTLFPSRVRIDFYGFTNIWGQLHKSCSYDQPLHPTLALRLKWLDPIYAVRTPGVDAGCTSKTFTGTNQARRSRTMSVAVYV